VPVRGIQAGQIIWCLGKGGVWDLAFTASNHVLRSPWGATREREMVVGGAPFCDLGDACAARAVANLLSEPLHCLQAFTHSSLLVTFNWDGLLLFVSTVPPGKGGLSW